MVLWFSEPLWLIIKELENCPNASGLKVTVSALVWLTGIDRGVSIELVRLLELYVTSSIIKLVAPLFVKEILLTFGIVIGTLPRLIFEGDRFKKGAFTKIDPEKEFDWILPRSVLEIIGFEIFKGKFPELEVGNKEKLKTSPIWPVNDELVEEKEITLRIFELMTEPDIVWSVSLPEREIEFSTYSTPFGIVMSNWKPLNVSMLFILTGIEILVKISPEPSPIWISLTE